MKDLPLVIMRQLTLILLLLPLLAQATVAQTLYERSLVQFQAKALKVPPGDFTFVALGDSRDGEEIFKKALTLAKSYDPLFILHGGDYTSTGEEGETHRFLRLLEETVPDLPVFAVLGNHEDPTVHHRLVGPFNFTLDSSRLGLRLVAVDNAEEALEQPELDYLRSRLTSAGGTTFAAMHIPPETGRWRWHTFTRGAGELEKIVAQSRAQALIFSHLHLFDRSEFGGVPAFVTGGAGAPLHRSSSRFPGDSEHHILVVRVKDGQATCRKVKVD